RPAVAMRDRIGFNEIAEQFVAAIRERAPFGIEGPLDQPAELIDVVNVALEVVRLQSRDGASRKTRIVNAWTMNVVLKHPRQRDERAGGNRVGDTTREVADGRHEQRQRGEEESLIANVADGQRREQ